MRILIAAAAMFAATAAFAADTLVRAPGGEPVYVVPAGAPVTKPVFARGEDISVTFAGKFVLAGIFHSEANGIAYLVPDRSVAVRLPRWQNSGPPHQIWFENAAMAIRALAPAHTAPATGSGGNSIAANADRHVELDVDRYTINIECDTASYYVRFLSVHTPARTVASDIEEEEGC